VTSTQDLSALPDIATLRRRMQALAMLDAILSPEWEYRYFSFDNTWAKGEQLGSMRDGEGSHYFAWFGPGSCFMKGFDPECPLSPFAHTPPTDVAEGVLNYVPTDFTPCLREPAFVLEETTFCIWRRTMDNAWQHGPVKLPADDPDPDGSARLLAPLDGNPHTYTAWAKEYFQRDVPVKLVEAVYAHQPLTSEMAKALGNTSFKPLLDDAAEIGYPIAPPPARR
jgi:hypothetical protein